MTCISVVFMCTFHQSLGNHEFDNGVSGLTPFIENVTCPVLCANLDLSNSPEMARETNLKKSIILNVHGVKIGIIGYLTPDTKKIAVPNNVEYLDEIVAIRKEVKKLQNDGVEIIIALGHSGHSKDLQIAREVDDIDLVIGGHTNTFLWNGTIPDSEESQGPYPTYVSQRSGKQVPVVQAYAYTKYLGRLHLVFDSNGELTKVDGHPILLDKTIPQDFEVNKITERYANDPQNIGNEIVGSSLTTLDGKSCMLKECNLGNLITDAILYYYSSRYKGKYWTDAAIVLLQGGAIRSSIAHVESPTIINKADLLNVMPFGGSLVKVTIKGNTVIQMLEHSVAKYSHIDFAGEFLQFSGLKVVYDLSKPVGSRVKKVEIRCSNCTIPYYSKVDNDVLYNIIVPDFMYNGGDGYNMLKNHPIVILNYKELECTEYYIRHHSPVLSELEGQITLLNENGYKIPNSASNMTFDLAIVSIATFILRLTN